MHRQGKVDVGIREFGKQKKDPFRHVFEIATTLVVLSVAVALGIVGWQGYTWSQTDAWPPVRFFDLLSLLGVDLHSAYYPEKGQEAANYLQLLLDLPAAAVLPACAFLLAAILSLFTRHGK